MGNALKLVSGMPTGALDDPSQRQDHPRATANIIENDARDHDHEIGRIEPEKFCPGILWPPVLAYFFHEAAPEQRFVNTVHHVSRHGEPKRDKQRDVHILLRLLQGKS